MQPQQNVTAADTGMFCQTCRAPQSLLRRLEKNIHRAGQVLQPGVQQQCCPYSHRRVSVMSAGVHQTGMAGGEAFRGGAVVRQTAFLYLIAVDVHPQHLMGTVPGAR